MFPKCSEFRTLRMASCILLEACSPQPMACTADIARSRKPAHILMPPPLPRGGAESCAGTAASMHRDERLSVREGSRDLDAYAMARLTVATGRCSWPKMRYRCRRGQTARVYKPWVANEHTNIRAHSSANILLTTAVEAAAGIHTSAGPWR